MFGSIHGLLGGADMNNCQTRGLPKLRAATVELHKKAAVT